MNHCVFHSQRVPRVTAHAASSLRYSSLLTALQQPPHCSLRTGQVAGLGSGHTSELGSLLQAALGPVRSRLPSLEHAVAVVVEEEEEEEGEVETVGSATISRWLNCSVQHLVGGPHCHHAIMLGAAQTAVSMPHSPPPCSPSGPVPTMPVIVVPRRTTGADARRRVPPAEKPASPARSSLPGPPACFPPPTPRKCSTTQIMTQTALLSKLSHSFCRAVAENRRRPRSPDEPSAVVPSRGSVVRAEGVDEAPRLGLPRWPAVGGPVAAGDGSGAARVSELLSPSLRWLLGGRIALETARQGGGVAGGGVNR